MKQLLKQILVSKLLFLAVFGVLFLQKTSAQEISSSVDTTQIKIGEQIHYKIKVEADTTSIIVFPEGQTFMPLEMVEAYKIDTTKLKEGKNWQLTREYALTQWDSGAYTIPRQKILVNNQSFFTDSVKVEVATVAVDTTKQEIFPIKPTIEIEKPMQFPLWIVWLLIGLLVIAGIVFLIIKLRKRKLEKEKQLPPYEQAIQTLHKLDESKTLEHGEMKAYYSTLTTAIKRYIDEEIDERALESTTDELITRLHRLKENQKIYLDQKVIDELAEILRRADLIKFAGGGMDKLTAKNDRKLIEEDINSIKESKPEPTEEERLQDEAYREEKRQKKKKRTIIFSIVGGVFLLLAVIVGFVAVKGYNTVKDQVFGTPTKELLKGEWVTSEYGNPSIKVSTPEVLRRTSDSLNLPAQSKAAKPEVFSYGALMGNFHIMITTVPFPPNTKFDFDKAVDGIYNQMEQNGARNILMKDEKFTIPSGQEGVKVFGSAVYKNPLTQKDEEKSYTILNLFEKGGLEQVTIIYNKNDEYAEEIANRVINSVEFNSEN